MFKFYKVVAYEQGMLNIKIDVWIFNYYRRLLVFLDRFSRIFIRYLKPFSLRQASYYLHITLMKPLISDWLTVLRWKKYRFLRTPGVSINCHLYRVGGHQGHWVMHGCCACYYGADLIYPRILHSVINRCRHNLKNQSANAVYSIP